MSSVCMFLILILFVHQLERLQGLLDQEKLTNQDMESLGEEILKEKQSLERDLHALKAEKDREVRILFSSCLREEIKFGELFPIYSKSPWLTCRCWP